MTIERASELVRELLLTNSNAAIDLFCYFVETLDIINSKSFAALCGFTIATNVVVITE